MPSGDAVQLTGRWRAPDGGTYYLRQVGSCVWFTGLSVDTDAPGGLGASQWTNAFLGTLQSDFTLHGEWADLPWGRDTGVGEITWRIDFAEVDGQEGVTLVVVEATGRFGAGFLVQPIGQVELHVRLQDSPDCLSVVGDDGAVYELQIATRDWSPAEPTSISGPAGSLIRPSEAFDVGGEIAIGSGECGPGTIIFADRIEEVPS